MALYEIRTMLSRHRTSLVSYGEFASDLSAILGARDLLRAGETVEVWRGDVLVFRTVPNSDWDKAKARRSNRQRTIRLAGWWHAAR